MKDIVRRQIQSVPVSRVFGAVICLGADVSDLAGTGIAASTDLAGYTRTARQFPVTTRSKLKVDVLDTIDILKTYIL